MTWILIFKILSSVIGFFFTVNKEKKEQKREVLAKVEKALKSNDISKVTQLLDEVNRI